jgi:hypothetical protein
LREEANDRGVLEQPVAVFVATLAVALLVNFISPFSIMKLALLGHLAREYAKVVHPPLGFGIKPSSGWIIDDFSGRSAST